jgi:alanyl-tRNA synthetase
MVVGTQAEARVDYAFRRRVAPNHTMTHALNFALRKVVSAEVDQKGSSVTDEKLRFDFNAKKALTPQQLLKVEKLLNELVHAGIDVSTQMVPLDEARGINGLRAVFGETYPDPVRVVSVGQAVGDLLASPSSPEWMDNSIEFCGGTHLQNTRDAVACCLVEEAAVAKGIRRISAITGPGAQRALQEGARLQSRLGVIASMLSRCGDSNDAAASASTAAASLAEVEVAATEFRVGLDATVMSTGLKSVLRGEAEQLQRAIMAKRNEAFLSGFAASMQAPLEEARVLRAQGQTTAVLRLDIGCDAKAVKRATSELQKAAPGLSFLAVSSDGDKVAVFAALAVEGSDERAGDSQDTATATADADALDAGAWVKAAVGPLGGRGGGRANAAQGTISAADPAVVEQALELARGYLQ